VYIHIYYFPSLHNYCCFFFTWFKSI